MVLSKVGVSSMVGGGVSMLRGGEASLSGELSALRSNS